MLSPQAHGMLPLSAIRLERERFKLLTAPTYILRLQLACEPQPVVQVGLKAQGFNGQLVAPGKVFAARSQLSHRALRRSFSHQGRFQIAGQAGEYDLGLRQVQGQIAPQQLAPGTTPFYPVGTDRQTQPRQLPATG